jgi:hypothetical protein
MGYTGLSRATVGVGNDISFNLCGLSMPGLEGRNEPSLHTVIEAIGITTDIGWQDLAQHTRNELQGEEIRATLFEKAGDGPVTMTPVARFSPPFALPFGYYLESSEGPRLKQVGILADSGRFHQHQTLMPRVVAGETAFNPAGEQFGIYVVSPTHISFSEDIWNQLRYPGNTAHAVRVYPARNGPGGLIKDTYLICFEEASNGDYQDYVFTLSNVRPLEPDGFFTQLLHENDLDGWKIFLESKGVDNDPEQIFTVRDGILHDIGKELGYIMTDRVYTNYHLKLEFKWGEKKWPPRDKLKRDSGICYHIPEGEPDRIWPQSIECQIQEGDVGDFCLLGYSTIEVGGEQNVPRRYSRVVKSADNEFPNGNWNTVEVLTFQGTCVHIVNGVVVNYGHNASLRSGRILLQSEYAEVFYRNVEIRRL